MSNGEHEIRTPKGLRIGNRSVVDGKNMLQIKRGGCEDYISAESLVECIDYSLKKVEQEGKTEYLVFFKAKDVDVMTAAFKEYTSETLKKQKRESVRQKLEKVKEELSNHRQLKKEKKREQEPTR